MLEVGLLELVAGLEGLVEDGVGEQVAHLQADERLAAARGGRGDVGVEAVVGSVFVLEEGLALDVDGFNECGHVFLRTVRKRYCCEGHRRPHVLQMRQPRTTHLSCSAVSGTCNPRALEIRLNASLAVESFEAHHRRQQDG